MTGVSMAAVEVPDLRDLTLPELTEWIGDFGEPSYRARQIFRWLWRDRTPGFGDMTDLPRTCRETLAERARLNYDHPDSLETSLLVRHIKQLLAWKAVAVPVYDFTQHRRTAKTVLVEPSPIILVDGILIFTKGKLRRLMDIKVYVDTDADVRFIRRLQRDMQERNRSLESVVTQYLETVRPMHLKFVEPSKRHADVIIPWGGHNQVAMDMVVARLRTLLPSQPEYEPSESAAATEEP